MQTSQPEPQTQTLPQAPAQDELTQAPAAASPTPNPEPAQDGSTKAPDGSTPQSQAPAESTAAQNESTRNPAPTPDESSQPQPEQTPEQKIKERKSLAEKTRARILRLEAQIEAERKKLKEQEAASAAKRAREIQQKRAGALRVFGAALEKIMISMDDDREFAQLEDIIQTALKPQEGRSEQERAYDKARAELADWLFMEIEKKRAERLAKEQAEQEEETA